MGSSGQKAKSLCDLYVLARLKERFFALRERFRSTMDRTESSDGEAHRMGLRSNGDDPAPYGNGHLRARRVGIGATVRVA